MPATMKEKIKSSAGFSGKPQEFLKEEPISALQMKKKNKTKC